MTKAVEYNPVSLELHDGLVHALYLSPTIDLEIARAIVKKRKAFTSGKTLPFLIEGTELSAINKEARDYFASKEGSAGVQAAAFVVRSVFQASMANFFIKVTRQDFPVKIFTDKEKAALWLHQSIDP